MNVVRPADIYHNRPPSSAELLKMHHELTHVDRFGIRHALYSNGPETLVEFAWYEPPVMPALQLEAVRE